MVQLVGAVGMVDRKDTSWSVYHLVSLFLLLIESYVLNQKSPLTMWSQWGNEHVVWSYLLASDFDRLVHKNKGALTLPK